MIHEHHCMFAVNHTILFYLWLIIQVDRLATVLLQCKKREKKMCMCYNVLHGVWDLSVNLLISNSEYFSPKHKDSI